MDIPVIITNFKTYEEGMGSKALELAKIHAKVAVECKASMAIVAAPTDIAMLSASVSFPVFAQHVDPVSVGANTGAILPEAVKDAGAWGTLINHSEKRMSMADIEKAVMRGKEVKLFTIVCVKDDTEVAEVMKFNPDMVAVEPPELIGGDVSVSTADPELIARSAKVIGKGKLLVGAGIKTGEDVRVALEQGASGVLLSSGVVKAQDPEAVLTDLCSGLRSS
ncbi:triose-phosphate isomerase [Candidatus Peregrinibacteria bacterium CG2_30_44_17]|nr:MAG: triose-phosphate isomerase [Candidatus Peregrinibacteria bacterium CG2_30_44_17]